MAAERGGDWWTNTNVVEMSERERQENLHYRTMMRPSDVWIQAARTSYRLCYEYWFRRMLWPFVDRVLNRQAATEKRDSRRPCLLQQEYATS
jgi:hypothetical protein